MAWIGNRHFRGASVVPVPGLILHSNVASGPVNSTAVPASRSPVSEIKPSADTQIEPLCPEPPDRVAAQYRDDLDITIIHAAILSRFEYSKKNISKIKEQITVLESQLYNATLNSVRETQEKINMLKSEIEDIETDRKLKIYMEESTVPLQQYRELAPSKVISIKGLVSSDKEDPAKIEARCRVIESYLDVARKWIKLEVTRIVQNKARCPHCNKDLSDSREEIELYRICECGYTSEVLSVAPSFKDWSRVNAGNHNDYDNEENFRKALLRYQGKQPKKPPARLYEQLDDLAISKNRPTGAYFRSLPLDANGEKAGTSKHQMFADLKETSNSAYYEDINLICHNYWGWELPDISHLEEQIMKDYNITQVVYNSIPNKDRIASLNTNFRLYVHLKAVGVNCSVKDFKIQVDRNSLLFHQTCWNTMCERTGIKVTQVI